MNQRSLLKLSLKHKSGKQQVVLCGLLVGFIALSLIGWGVKAGGLKSGQAAKLLTPASPSATITVNSVADGAPANNGQCTLREAILNANANNQSGSTDCAAGNGADTITFSLPAGAQTINLTGVLPDLIGSISIVNSTGPANLTVRRNTGGNYQIFNVASGSTVSISGLTAKDGVITTANSLGAGISNLGNLTLTQVVVTGNTNNINSSGGVYNGGGATLTMTNCSVTANTSTFNGGGIFNEGTLTMTGCTLNDNFAESSGGALFLIAGTTTLTNCTISGNNGDLGNGGAIYVAAPLTMTNCTLTANSAHFGSGIVLGNGGTATLRNNIIANNLGGGPINISGAVNSLGHNLIGSIAGSSGLVASDLKNVDPKLAPLADNGGPTLTHALQSDSPAIDHGTAAAGVTLDQRGILRPQDDPAIPNSGGGDGSDIGAFELPSFVVINTNDAGAGSLRQALLTANQSPGADTITFSLSAGPQTIKLAGALPNITDSVNISNSTGPANLTVRRDTGGNYRIFNIPGGGLNVVMNGLTIRDGLLISDGAGGAGIRSASQLTLTDCVITNNETKNTSAAFGGGVALLGSGVGTFTNCTISGNKATPTDGSADAAGGGVVIRESAAATFTGCTISDNTATDRGGGIYSNSNDSNPLTLSNCTVSGNTLIPFGPSSLGAAIGIAVQSAGATVRVTNCTITNNTSPETEGGIRMRDVTTTMGTLLLRNTIIANNTAPNLKVDNVCGSALTINSQGGNLTSDDGSGFLTQATDQINKDPLLAPLADYGGRTYTRALLPGSPAINAGTNTGAPAADQRGIARVSAPDSGAFESRGFALAAASGGNQSAVTGAAFASPLVLTVSSGFGEPVVGGQVAFLPPVSGASALLAPNPAAINANNRAIAVGTANNQAGSYQVTATANGGNAANFTLTNVQCQTISISPTNLILPAGTAGQPYSQTFTQTGGAGAITWSVTPGSLPGNLSLAPASGVLAGTPTTFGGFNFTVTATDANGCTGARVYTLTINPPCAGVTVNPATLSDGTVGTIYNATVSATGGVAPYTFTVSAGALPDGLSLNASTGAISGTPTQAANFNFTIKATDANNCIGTRAYTLVINGVVANNGLQFYPLAAPVRLLDTRPGASPNACSQPNAPIAGGTSRTQPSRSFCGIPANAQAITGNITTVASGGGYLTLYPSNSQQPLVANTNYSPNEIVNNVFTVGLGAGDGAFKVFALNTTDVVIDVTGYYAPPAANGLYFHPLPHPIRLLETRAGQTGCDAPGTAIQEGDTGTRTQLARTTCDGVTIPSGALAIVGNATTVSPQAGGYLTLFPAGAVKPLVASSNYSAGQIVNGPFTVGLSASGRFNIFTAATTHLVVDVLGYYSAEASDVNGTGLLFNPLPKPVRLLETRAGQTGCFTPGAPIVGGVNFPQQARGTCGGELIPQSAQAIVGNATVVNSNGGYLTLWPSTSDKPLVAASNFDAGQVLNRHFTVGLGGDGVFKIFSLLTTDLVVDVAGYFAP